MARRGQGAGSARRADVTGAEGGASRAARRRLRAGVLAAAAAAAVVVAWMARGVPFGLPARDCLLLITLDTTRADRLGAYGWAKARTPNLDRLAAEGVRFEQAFSPVPITLPSHASIFTGLYPPSHGVRNNGHRLGDGVETIADVLAGHGYRTAAFVSAFVLDRRFGLARSFATYDDAVAAGGQQGAGIDAERRGDLTAQALVRWLEAQPAASRKAPFFAWLHLYDPHDPYRPPAPFDAMFPGSPYDGEIALTDAAVGEVLEALGRLGLADRVIVAIVGDHGESLGEHGEDTHGMFVYEAAIRVPFVLWGPGRIPSGRVVRSLVRTIDVGPTLLALLGARSLRRIEGRSLLGSMEGGSEGGAPPLYAETLLPQEFMGWAPLRAVREERFKLIEAPRPELYDLQRDPAETENLHEGEARMVAALRREIERHAAAAAARSATTPPREDERAIDAEAAEKLAALGYVGMGGAAAAPELKGADPKDVVDLFNRLHRANLAVRERRFADALPLLQEILREHPGNTEVLLRLGNANLGLGRFREARDFFRAFAERTPKSAVAHHWIAVCSLRLGETDLALREADAAVALDPGLAEARAIKGALLSASGDFEGAIRELRAAVAADPGKAAPRVSLARALAARGRRAEAEEEYEAVVARYPDDADALTGLGVLVAGRGDPIRAEELLRRALASRPADPAAFFDLALVLEQQGRRSEATEAYRRLSRDPSAPPAIRLASQRRLASLGL